MLNTPILPLVVQMVQFVDSVGDLEQALPKVNDLSIHDWRIGVCKVLVEVLLPIFKYDVVIRRGISSFSKVVLPKIFHDTFIVLDTPERVAFELIDVFPTGEIGFDGDFVALK